MKKLFFTALVLTALLTVTVGTAFAGSALELIQVRNDEGVPTFVFQVTGEFSQEELQNGFVSVQGGEDFPLFCAQQDADTVVCHTSKPVAGHDIVVGFGGARFWTNVPEYVAPPTCDDGWGYWYAAYDWPGPFSPPGTTEWSYFADVCLDDLAYEGQRIVAYNPEYASAWPYDFWGAGVDAYGWANPGEGFYYYFH